MKENSRLGLDMADRYGRMGVSINY